MKIQTFICIFLVNVYFVSGRRFQCPYECSCRAHELLINCYNRDLSDLPDEISPETVVLNLSFNNLTEVPNELSNLKKLEQLYLSHNKISFLTETSLEGLHKLNVLDLSYNAFNNWLDINQNAFLNTPVLMDLNLTNNYLGNYPDVAVNYTIKSDSLRKLNLINCSIEIITGNFISEMRQLEELYLSHNPLIALNTQFTSDTLQLLDLTQCGLQRIHSDVFIQLHNLQELILSRNFFLKRFNCASNSLKYLDLSHCNLESLPVHKLPNLLKANFKGNHLRRIPDHGFKTSPLIQQLDLSNNAIKLVDLKAFRDLKFVQTIDLSFNTISHLASETFMLNNKLQTLNLSRNYISDMGQFVMESLKWLDVSVCEIQRINRDSLLMMPNLQGLNLSRNLITTLPNRLQADKLTILDLSMCGIFALNNLTFVATTNLRYLNLAGNRLTSGVRPEFFYDITTVKLDTNPWLCDCASEEFKELYDWLFHELLSTEIMRCRSPESVAGLTWENACHNSWIVLERAAPHQMWIYSMSLVLVMCVLCFVIMSIRHLYHKKAAREREVIEQEREDARDRLRRMQRNARSSRESINRNAPDPRDEPAPPTYVEAISMPRLNMSTNSLAGSLHSLQSTSSQPEGLRRSRRTSRRKKRSKRLGNKDGVASETQSAVSLTNVHSSSSDNELGLRSVHRNVTESNF